MKIKILNKIFILFLLNFFLNSLNCLQFNTFALEINDEKIYCNATIEDEFADNRVLVVLDNESSSSSKIYSNVDSTSTFFNEKNIF